MADGSKDDDGVLGNLPRKRPGTRSDKRSSGAPAKSAERAARRAESEESPAAEPAPGSRPSGRARPKPAAAGRRAAGAAAGKTAAGEEAATAGDPVGELLRGGLRVAGSGLRAADSLAREVIRRLPRP